MMACMLAALLALVLSPADGARISRIEAAVEAGKAKGIADVMALLHVPGVSVAVINEGKIAWSRGYGMRDTKAKLQVDPETRFQAASTSKPVFAMGVMALVQRRKLDLDQPVNEALRSWKVPESEFTKTNPVTLRRLLSHSAGLTVWGFPGYGKGAQVPTLPAVLSGTPPANTPPVTSFAEPGKQQRYSGGGISVAQLLVEESTGAKLAPLMQRLVLGPLGMRHSTYNQPLPPSVQNVAVPYRGDLLPVIGGPHTYPEQAAAGLWTTPSDLCRFLLELGNALNGKGKVLKQEAAQEMTRKQSAPGDSVFGIGIGLGPNGELTHGGANEGYRCIAVYLPATKQGYAIMTNSDWGGPLYQAIGRAIRKEYGWPSP